LSSLFGLQLSQPFVYIAAIAIILMLLAVFAWVLRKISGNSTQSESSGRGRQPRLGIVETFQLDRQRQLVIVRRDSVEHLLLLGGTSDLVVEGNIVRAMATPAQLRDTNYQQRAPLTPSIAAPPKPAVSTVSQGPTEMSFAMEPKATEAFSSPLPANMDTQENKTSQSEPLTRDLAEIASRFQTGIAKPIVAEREISMSPTAPIPFAARVQPQSQKDDSEPAIPPRTEAEPIIPSLESNIASPSSSGPAVQARDIGSLNDTLRQLLGRTRES